MSELQRVCEWCSGDFTVTLSQDILYTYDPFRLAEYKNALAHWKAISYFGLYSAVGHDEVIACGNYVLAKCDIVTHCARSIWRNESLPVKMWMLSQAPRLTRRLGHDTDVRGFVHLCLCHRR